jgi:hypothetical protein
MTYVLNWFYEMPIFLKAAGAFKLYSYWLKGIRKPLVQPHRFSDTDCAHKMGFRKPLGLKNFPHFPHNCPAAFGKSVNMDTSSFPNLFRDSTSGCL